MTRPSDPQPTSAELLEGIRDAIRADDMDAAADLIVGLALVDPDAARYLMNGVVIGRDLSRWR
jgi:hypothetical protein